MIATNFYIGAVEPIAMKYCIDAEYPESAFVPCFLIYITAYCALVDNELRSRMEVEAEQVKTSPSRYYLHMLFNAELGINVRTLVLYQACAIHL